MVATDLFTVDTTMFTQPYVLAPKLAGRRGRQVPRKALRWRWPHPVII
jgi:hypothetical protein